MFSSFIGKNSTAEKAKLPLVYSDFYINFASDLTSFLLGESRRVERIDFRQRKRISFHPLFTLISLYFIFIQHFPLSSNEVENYPHCNKW